MIQARPAAADESLSVYAPVNRSSEEIEMRRIIVPELRRRWPQARIVHELGLRYATNSIDIAAIGPSEIVGVEIKSSRDVLDRLEGQVRAFAPICSQIIVALAPRWCAAPEAVQGGVRQRRKRSSSDEASHDAIGLLRRIGAPNVEAWLCCAETGSAQGLDSWSSARRFPWAYPLLEMLRVSELEQIASRHSIAPPTRHDRLVAALHDQMKGNEVVPAVCRVLRARVSPHPLSDVEIVA
jgi:hypothetical protein